MSDLISRQAAIDAVKKNTFRLTFAEEQNCEGHLAWSANAVYSDVIEGALLELPSAQPKRKHGKWIKASGSWCTPGGDPVWECSECGKGRHVYGIEWRSYGNDVADGQWVSCPNCGADMREVDDERPD